MTSDKFTPPTEQEVHDMVLDIARRAGVGVRDNRNGKDVIIVKSLPIRNFAGNILQTLREWEHNG